MATNRFALALITALCVVACRQSAPVPAATANLKPEAEAFMVAYARELRAHDRKAIIARYDPRGSFSLGDGLNEFWTPEKIASFYRTWQGPEVFEFADLAYETLGPDAVVVVGLFRWKEPGKPEGALVSYTALLTRHDGRLRIRLEHESAKASAP